jgi:hypothetical protein
MEDGGVPGGPVSVGTSGSAAATCRDSSGAVRTNATAREVIPEVEGALGPAKNVWGVAQS